MAGFCSKPKQTMMSNTDAPALFCSQQGRSFFVQRTYLQGGCAAIPLPGGSTLGLSLLVMILIPAGVYFTIRTRFLPFRLFPEMIKVTLESHQKDEKESISGLQALIVSTACRVGMGNLVGVVARLLDVGDCPAGLLHRFH